MEEDIKILEKALKVLKGEDTKLTFGFEETAQAIENLIKGYRELGRLYKSEKEMKIRYVGYYQDLLLKENCIPKSKIKEKIEELKNKPVCLCTRSNGKNDEALQHFINNTVVKVLQELMEDK